jgi:putative sugar O-methyltransferase
MNDDFAGVTARMMDELEHDPKYLPSLFWRDINAKNLSMLDADGIENFKRSLSQNYYNFCTIHSKDVMFRTSFADWLANPTLAPLLTRMEHFVTLDAFYLKRPEKFTLRRRLIYRLFVSFIWEKMLRADTGGLAVTLAEPEIGNPVRIWRKGKLISQDLANSVMECNAVLPLLKEVGRRPRIAELGAGYGRLAYVFSATQQGTYFIFDIPPALYVSHWYLSRVLPGKKLFKFRPFGRFKDVQDEIEAADIAFLTANQLQQFPQGYFDVMITISTLPEMRPEQVALFLDLFQRSSRGHIFIKQWMDWTNPSDGTRMKPDDYALGESWKMVMDRIDPINPRFFNRVWRRV